MFYSRLEVNLGVFVCESDDPPPCAVDDKDSSQSVAADNHMLDLRPSPLFPEAVTRLQTNSAKHVPSQSAPRSIIGYGGYCW